MHVTWLGHASFLLELKNFKILIDPFISGNPSFPEQRRNGLRDVDAILLTHGHGDHLGDALSLVENSKATVVAIFELAQFMITKGVDADHVIDMNIGGSVKLAEGITVHMVQAVHSNSIHDGQNFIYGGFPTGFVVEADGVTLYHAGDTGLFSDMKLIQEFYRPDVALLPIGDHYTMSPKAAAFACNELLNCKTIIPMHYDTFPLLTGKADEFQRLVKRGQVVVLKSGEGTDV